MTELNDIRVIPDPEIDETPNRHTRRRFLASSTAAGVLSLIPVASRGANRPRTPDPSRHSAAASEDAAIRPFRIHVATSELHDLRRRVVATQWPERETVSDATQGVRLETLRKLASYWANSYDWRKVEARVNALPQFVTTVDGLDIHFLHVRSRHSNAMPVIVTHGWPGSIIEQLKIIGPLTDPTVYGGKPEDAFDVVIPSLPGHGFSAKPTATGWDPIRIASAWIVLMRRIGYTRFVAQGGDLGECCHGDRWLCRSLQN